MCTALHNYISVEIITLMDIYVCRVAGIAFDLISGVKAEAGRHLWLRKHTGYAIIYEFLYI